MGQELPTTVLLTTTGVAGETIDYIFTDGSIKYYESVLKNAFSYTMIDNLGSGMIRVSYNRPYLDTSDYIDGAKTLRTWDSLYIEEEISNIKIYFVEDSIVELILKSDKDP